MFGLKFFSVAIVLACSSYVSVNAKITAEERAAIRADSEPYIQECANEFGLSEEQVEEFKNKKKLSEVDPCYISCFFKKSGLLDSKGKYNADKAVELAETYIKNEDDLAAVKKIKQDCAKVNDEEVTDGEKGCQRAKLLVDCFKAHKDVLDLEEK